MGNFPANIKQVRTGRLPLQMKSQDRHQRASASKNSRDSSKKPKNESVNMSASVRRGSKMVDNDRVMKRRCLHPKQFLDVLRSQAKRMASERRSASPYVKSGRITRKHHKRKLRLNHLDHSRPNPFQSRLRHLLPSHHDLRSQLQYKPRKRPAPHLDLYQTQQRTPPARIAQTAFFQATLLLLRYNPCHIGQLITQPPQKLTSRTSAAKNRKRIPRQVDGPVSHSWSAKWSENESGNGSGRKDRSRRRRLRGTRLRVTAQGRLGMSINMGIWEVTAKTGLGLVWVLEERGGKLSVHGR